MNSRKPAIRLLMLEDSATDAELIERALRKAESEFTVRRVEGREQFVTALDQFHPQIILADYRLPGFDGLAALAIVQEKMRHIPFIFVTGAMGEEFAIETLLRGATDYVLKDHLSKLVPAVERALKEAESKTQRRRAEEALRERLDEVERLNRLMVGRELRMVELKKTVTELRETIGKLKQRLGERPADE